MLRIQREEIRLVGGVDSGWTKEGREKGGEKINREESEKAGRAREGMRRSKRGER